MFGNNNSGSSNPFGGNNLLGGNAGINNSLNNLLESCDPRDQLAQDIRMFNQTGIGNVKGMLETRLGQIDSRDQEAYDIRATIAQFGSNTLWKINTPITEAPAHSRSSLPSLNLPLGRLPSTQLYNADLTDPLLAGLQSPRKLSLPSEMTNEDWKRFVQRMKNDLDLTVCHHTEEKSGIFTEKWGCGRKVESDDLCEQMSSNFQDCIDYISQYFEISDDTASHIINDLEALNLLRKYKCNAVFFF